MLCCACVTINFNLSTIAAVIPTISESFGLSDVVVSRVISFYMIPYGVGALMFAPLTRSVTYRRCLVVSMVLYAVANLVCASTTSIQTFFVGMMAMGFTAAGVIPLGLMVIGELFEKNIRGRLVGGFFSCAFASSLAGNITSGFVSWHMLFYVPAVLAAATAIGLLALPTQLLSRTHKEAVNYWEAFGNSQIRRVFIFIAAMSFLYHGIIRWYGVYLHNVYGLDQFGISIFFSLVAIAGGVGQNIGGQLTDKKGRRFAAQWGLVVLAAATMMLIGQYSPVVLGAILVVLTMGWTVSHNGLSTTLTDFPDSERPVIASLNSSVRFVAGGIGFFATSFLVQKSFGITFFAIGLLLLAASFVLKRVIPN